jgi:uncharacterized membrane protein
MNKKPLLRILPFAIATSLALTSCTKMDPHSIVMCEGVSTNQNKALYIDKGICEKLAGGKPSPSGCHQWRADGDYFTCLDNAALPQVKNYAPSDYIKCYGIVAAGMNDCGTPTTACGGSVKVARDKTAWIAIPNGICEKIKGARAEVPEKK